MKANALPLQNQGMSRDISISKSENKLAFENHNIRIEARENDTMLSVTNERGNKKINLSFKGILLGYNVLNEYIILFTSENSKDRIYRVKYDSSSESNQFTSKLLFEGTLGFSLDNPIESIVSYETPTIQKIYWVDGKNVLRFINFVDNRYNNTLYDSIDTKNENGIQTVFDVNRGASFNIGVNITKDNSGQNRPNGVVQYIVTYYNKNGIQTSYVYISDIIYLSPETRGGSADGTNCNSISITLSDLDTSFDYVRVYSIVRTSYNGIPSAYIVGEASVEKDKSITIVDNGSHLESFDYSELLYLGSRPVIANTITHKDGTLFLGGLKSVGNGGFDNLEKIIKDTAFKSNKWESDIVEFKLTDNEEENIPYVSSNGLYPYKNQMKDSSSRITTFKGGEKYRFALRFRKKDGTESSAIWIGDKVNIYYPMIESSSDNSSIRRPIAICNLSSKPKIIEAARTLGFESVTLCIAKADYSDRSVIAQGIVCPTVFNNLFRCNNAPFLQPSWIFRPRKSNIANRHYSVLKKSSSRYGELQSNWWEDSSQEPTPYYYTFKENNVTKIANQIDGMGDFTYFKFAVLVSCDAKLNPLRKWWGTVLIAKYIGTTTTTKPTYTGREGITDEVLLVRYKIEGNGYNKAGLEYLRTSINDKLFDERISTSIESDTMNAIAEKAKDYSKVNRAGHVFYSSGRSITTQSNIIGYTDDANIKTIEDCIADAGWIKASSTNDRIMSSYFSRYTRNFFFVDEHAVTFNSPEIQYEKVNVDNNSGLKFRIVGASRITGNISDYTIDYTNGHRSGEHINEINFSRQNIEDRPDGLLSWPVYMESSMFIKETDDENDGEEMNHPESRRDDPVYDYTYNDYLFGSGIVSYMMNMWHHSGSIPELYDSSKSSISELNNKIFANLRYSYYTVYNNYKKGTANSTYNDCFWNNAKMSSIRQFNALDKQLMDIKYDGETKEYSGTESQIITMPGFNKYPILMTDDASSVNDPIYLEHYLRSQSPVLIEYRSTPHAVICFGNNEAGGQIVLPKTEGMRSNTVSNGDYDNDTTMTSNIETAEIVKPVSENNENYDGPFVPWSSTYVSSGYAVAYFNNVGTRKDFDVSIHYGHAYMPYDENTMNGISNALVMACNTKLYMLLKWNNKINLCYVDYASKDSFTVDLFNINILFKRTYFDSSNIKITPFINPGTSSYLKVNGIECSNHKYTIEVFKDGSWITATSSGLDLTTMNGNISYTFRIKVEYTDDVYGDVVFYTDSHTEKISDIDNSGNGREDREQELDTDDVNGNISLLSLDMNENETESGAPGSSDNTGGGSGDVEEGGSGGTGTNTNTLKNTNHIFEICGKSYETDDDSSRRIKIHYDSSVELSNSSFGENGYVKVVDLSKSSDNVYTISDGGTISGPQNNIEISYKFSLNQQDTFKLEREDKKYLGPNDEYLFIGELYYDYDSDISKDTRYGGISENAIESNVFIDCSKPYELNNSVSLTGNIGDTYFQRWDCMKTVPYSKTSVNSVIEIASFMVETHINIEGRTDLDRGVTSLASIDYDNFGNLNSVYSQENNFIQTMDTDESLNEDSYETSVTWTLEKKDGQEIDPWTHITLASSISLDGDKGKCNALARFNNTILAFQDRGICEIMFNSRTQLSTENGVPIEIANSGKVDGKRYISNKYGCTNKWSIAEGKAGLYFIDNINKIIGVFNGESIGSLSNQSGFDSWVRRNNVIKSWSPNNTNAFRTFYDKVHSDVYFVNSIDNDNPCLVYNESLGTFTSFFDYKDVPMMANVFDRFVSYKANHLYLQNEGDWCSIFGEQKPFWITWKANQDPYTDKIWTNIEYRADFFDNPCTEDVILSDKYIKDTTFDKLIVENEYQKGEVDIESGMYPGVEKKFRIWRLDIPRDMNSAFNLDRIRNPWVFITLKKNVTKSNEMMNLHDVIVKYYSE